MVSLARPFRVLTVACVPCALAGCITSPKSEVLRQQQMVEVGDAINDLRVSVSTMAGTLDSLRIVVAKQDTTIARLANVAGVIVVK